MRSVSPGLNERTYQDNYVFDDLQDEFDLVKNHINFTRTTSCWGIQL